MVRWLKAMTEQMASTADVEAMLDRPMLDVRCLHRIWAARQPVMKSALMEDRSAAAGRAYERSIPWLQDSAEIPRLFVRRALDAGEFLLASDAAREALHFYRADVELQQSLAQALARLGSVEEARAILGSLEGGQTLTARALCRNLCLLGDVLLDGALAAEEREAREVDLRSALDLYQRASQARPADVSPMLQAAVVALLLGREGEAPAQSLAGHALRMIEDAAAKDEWSVYLRLADAKARAVLGRMDEAKTSYRAVASWPEIAAHVLGAARKEARLIAGARGEPESFFDKCFPPLQLLVFSGHMLDRPGRRPPRFPASAEARVRDLVRQKLSSLQARVGFASAAAGSDLIFLEEMLQRGGVVHVVLPWARDAFLGASVAPSGSAWVDRFDRVLAQAASVRILGELSQPSNAVGFDYTIAVMSGLARLTARALDLELVPLVVWDGRPGLPGGTGSFVNAWRAQAVAPEIIDLGHDETGWAPEDLTTAAPRTSDDGRAAAATTLRQEIRTMLFGDIVGYSKLSEALVPDFVHEFMGRVSRLVSDSPYPPLSVNTWGDAVYFVFDRAESAGLFALDLTDMIANTTWEDFGLFWPEITDGVIVNRPLSIRIGLHSGPVFVHFDPIVRHLGFTGAHVSRAARIEPVTEPGKVFASEAFAALAALEKAQGFACDFAGTMPLAKKYPGEFRIYRLRRVRSLPVDALARVIHEEYCRAAIQRWETPATNSSLRSWEELPADLQASNREQAADIPAKLRALGYEIEPSRADVGPTFVFAPQELEKLARREHDRWVESRRRQGWVYAPGPKDQERKTNPCLVPWEDLPEAEREKDYTSVRSIPHLLAVAGFRVRRVASPAGRGTPS